MRLRSVVMCLAIAACSPPPTVTGPAGGGTGGNGGTGGGSSGTGGGVAGGGGGGAGGGVEPPGCPAGSTKIDVVAPMFDIPQKSDFYQCFAQTVTLPGKEHAFKIDKVIDDARVLHHVVLFRDLAKN